MTAMEFPQEHAIRLSSSETMLIQAFKKLIYDYHVRSFPDNHAESHASPVLVSEHLPEYQLLCQEVHPHITAHSTRLRALFSVTKHLCENNIPGNFVEFGFAHSISAIVLAYVIKQYSRTPRLVYILPLPTDGKLTSHSDGLDQEIPDEVVQDICTKLELSDIMITTRTEYQAIVERSPSIVGMIAFLHCTASFHSLCIEHISRLKHQLVGHAFVQVDERFSQGLCRVYANYMRSSKEADVTFHTTGDDFIWFRIPDVRVENPLILRSTVEYFKRDEQRLMNLTSQMSANERFQLHYLLSTIPLGDKDTVRFVEIGSYSGCSFMLTYLALQRRFLHVQGFAIEPHGTSQFYDIIQKYRSDIVHLKMFSNQAAPLLEEWFERDNALPSFIFVDGNHRYEHVRQDIIQFLPLLARNGLIVFHDYLPPLNNQNREAILVHHAGKEPGIRRACAELIEATNQYQVLNLPLLYPDDLAQTQVQLPIIPGVQSTLRAYKKLI